MLKTLTKLILQTAASHRIHQVIRSCPEVGDVGTVGRSLMTACDGKDCDQQLHDWMEVKEILWLMAATEPFLLPILDTVSLMGAGLKH